MEVKQLPQMTITLERWAVERHNRLAEHSGGIVPPWLLPENQPRIPELPVDDK